MDPYSDPAYVQAKQASDTAYQQYGTAQKNATTMPDLLKSALDKKFASNDNPINTQREAAYADYAGANNTGYQAVLPKNNQGMIFSPESQMEQIQGRRNSALQNILMYNRLAESGLGGINNTIDSATRMYTAQENAAKLKADMARQKVQDLFEEIAAKEKIRQFNENLKLEKEKAKTAGGSDLSSLLALLLAGQGGQGTTQNQGVDLSAAVEEDKPQKKDYKLNLSNTGTGLSLPGLSSSGNMTLTTNPQNAVPQKKTNKTGADIGAHNPTSQFSTFKF